MHYREVIRRPIITEKSNQLADEEFQYVFEVHPDANKHQIKEAMELIWPKVNVQKVRVMQMPAKRTRRWRKTVIRRSGWKKAVVTLAPGQRLEIFEGV
jgi:large subunit ribosomal protein L23